MSRIPHRIALVLLATMTALLGGCGKDIHYDTHWSTEDVFGVVSQANGTMALIGVDPVTARVRTLAPINVKQAGANVSPEANVLRSGGQVWLMVTDGPKGASVYSVDVAGHAIHRRAYLDGARLPVLTGTDLGAVIGSDTGFRLRRYTLPSDQARGDRAVPMTPVDAQSHCLVGATYGDSSRIMLLSHPFEAATPIDVAAGVPGGVACAGDVAVVTVSAVADVASSQQPSPGDSVVVVRGDRVSQIKVGSQPVRVAIDDGATTAVVEVGTPTGRGLAVLDLASGRVTRTVTLPDGTSIEGMALRNGRVVALSDTTALVCSLADGHLVTTPLPGQVSVGHPG